MITLENFEPVPDRFRHAYLAVGNFDGVHLGHRALIGRLRELADQAGVPAIALTFDPRPVEVLRPERAGPPLTWTALKVALLAHAGVDEVGVFRTGRWLLGLTAREFFERVVIGQFAARGMVEGPTFGFGRDRGGDAQILGEWCRESGLGFEIVASAECDGRPVSSSRVREALGEGRVAEAARLLGRPHRLRGTVTQGAGRGAGLGFPTANLTAIDTLIPAHGVYAARAVASGDRPLYPAAVHIGPNATFGERVTSVEAHLIGFAGDLYGRTLQLDFLEFLRPTRAFAEVSDLLAQIGADVARARLVAGEAG